MHFNMTPQKTILSIQQVNFYTAVLSNQHSK